MHKFAWHPAAEDAKPFELLGAYLVGADGVPIRGEISLEQNLITCKSRHPDALGISLLWPVEGYGTVQLETTRLPARDEPYNVHVEIVRQRLLRISTKCEEWGLFDYPRMEDITTRIDQARDLFVDALKHAREPAVAARSADRALSIACRASDDLCRFHAGVFLNRRRQTGGFARHFLGVALPSEGEKTRLQRGLADVFDFVRVPFVWRSIHPKEQGTQYEVADALVRSAAKAGLALRGGPLLNFGVSFVPDWMYIWENDYEAIADFARDHVKRTVQRYAGKVDSWIVASGLHADSVFPFNFEQIMDLTRLAAGITKQIDARAQVVLDITQPWGEYYVRNQNTIPPLLYAEMAVQSGVPFDALGLQFLFGIDSDGFHLRDLLQISSLIDRLANLGKQLQITAVAVPSSGCERGCWGAPWTEKGQADWFAAFHEIALSKPYVESVCAYSLTDAGAAGITGGGILSDDMKAKPVFERLARLRRRLQTET